MKRKNNLIFIAFMLFLFGKSSFAQNNVGINASGANPHPSAALDVDANNKGVLIPRLTTSQRLSIVSPANGLLVYDTDDKCVFFYDQTTSSWISLCLGGGLGVTGPTGPQGNNGAIGPTGPAGTNGVNGATGPAGVAGTNGVNGATGPTGAAGINGVNGATGPAGAAGTNGVNGATGPTGAAGTNGANGATGPAGAQGPQGNVGTTGPTGTAGATGAQGIQGIQGIQGVQGSTGAQGPVGLTGSTGAQGIQGIQGIQGVQGFTGAIGPTGPTGPIWTITSNNFNTNGTQSIVTTIPSTITSINGAWLTTGNTAAAANYIGTNNAIDFRMYSNGLERMTIESGGYIGIGTANPAAYVHYVAGVDNIWETQWDNNNATAGAAGRFQNTNAINGNRVLMGCTNYDASVNEAAAVIGLSLNGTTTGIGGIGVLGSANNESGNAVEGSLFYSGLYSGWAGYFNGDVYSGGSYSGSDRRLKKDILPIQNALDIVSKIEPVSFYYDTEKYPQLGLDENRLTYGFIAQDLEKVLPTLVKEKNLVLNSNRMKTSGLSEKRESDQFKVVNYTLMIPILTEAIKEQQKLIVDLQAKNAEHEKLNQDLQKQIDMLKIQINK